MMFAMDVVMAIGFSVQFLPCVCERERERRLLNVIWSPQIFTFGWLYIAVLCMWSSITAPARMGGCAKFREQDQDVFPAARSRPTTPQTSSPDCIQTPETVRSSPWGTSGPLE